MINEETVGTHPQTGRAEAHTVMDRPVGAKPLPPATMLFPEHVCEEAFLDCDDRLCVPRQIAAVLKRPMGDVLDQLREAELQLLGTDTIESLGCTPRVVLQFCRSQGLGAAVVHNEAVVETLPGKPTLAFTVHEGHAFFYNSPHVRRSLQKRRPGGVAKMKKLQAATTTPPLSEWQEWSGEVAAGHLWALEDDLPSIRAQLLRGGRNCKVLMRDSMHPRGLLYNLTKRLDGEQGVLHVHGLPEKWQEIQEWAERLGFEYRGEGLPGCALKVLQGLVRRGRERVYLDGQQKADLLEQFDHRCASCGSRSSHFDWDHVARLSESFGAQEFQPLCAQCHREKTTGESRALDASLLTSAFCKETWDKYVLSPRQPPLVYCARELPETLDGFEIADVRRCRKRAFEFSVHSLPLFAPLDDVRVRETCDLGDLNFVNAKYTSFIRQLGYSGPGWQHRVLTEWLLHSGTICWADVTHTLTATARYPAGLLQEPLRQMEAAWNGSHLAKLSANAIAGLWAIDDTRSFKCRSSRHDTDAPEGAAKHIFQYGEEGETLFDFITADQLITNHSCRPLSDLALSTEATRVGQMLYVIKQCRAVPYELKTDSCLFRPQKRRKVPLAELRFQDLASIRARFEPAPGMRRLDERALVAHNPSSELVFRCGPAGESDRLKMQPAMPHRSTESPGNSGLAWEDLDLQSAEERVMRGQGLLLVGIAGTGKTHAMAAIVERLRAAGRTVDVISKTHMASRRAGGTTADHWVRRHLLHGTTTCDALWIDECGQVDVGIWAQLAKLSFAGVQVLLSGDFQQFPPLSNYWKGCQVPEEAFEQSSLLHTFASGNRCVLTECRRGDRRLFDFYSSLVPGGSRYHLPVADAVKEAKREFRHDGSARWNLVISHRKRVELNRVNNRAAAPDDAVFLEVKGRAVRGNAAQSMLAWPGIELLGCVSAERKGIRNGCLYTVERIDVPSETLRLAGVGDVTFDQAKAWLRLSYAQTYASCQGTEFAGSLRLHDCSHKWFSRRHLFVGLSRAKQDAAVSLRD